MYRVWFTFKGKRDCRDNNGKGLKPSEAFYVAGELKAQGKTRVSIVRIGSIVDREKQRGV